MPKITIIDDDLEFAQNLELVLGKRGHSVSVHDRVEGALEKLRSERPEVLVLDVMFPEKPAGGFDLAREIRKDEQLADLPVLLLTLINQEFPMDFSAGDIDPEWMPVQDFVEKGTELGELVERIEKLAGRRG